MVEPAAGTRPLHGPLIAACFLLSGFSALVYQTAWTLELAFVFGSSEAAAATVLAVFLAGLGAGAALAARQVDGVRRPLRVYAWLEAAIALSALAAPFAIRGVGSLYVLAFGNQPELPAAAEGPRLLVMAVACVALLGIPTALMGATLPLLARQVIERSEQIGSRVGSLYAVNTLGAVAGTLGAAFVLLPGIGLGWTQGVAALVNLAIAGAAGALSLHTKAIAVAAPRPKALHARVPLVLVAMAASGFVTFSYEVLWFRLLRFLLAGSAHAFAIMLACFLLGIAGGSAAVAGVARDRERARRGFVWAQLGIAVGALVAWAGLDAVPSLGGGVAPRAGVALLLLLPSTLCIGATFPFAVRWLAAEAADAGSATARVYAWNTAGAVLGAALTGYWLLPVFGFAGLLPGLVLASLLLAVAATLATTSRRSLPLPAAVGGATLALALTQGAPDSLLNHDPLSGRLRPGPALFHAVGQTTTVGITRRGSRFELTAGGLTQSLVEGPHTAPQAHTVERWLGALGAYARPEARSLLLVGLGGGVSIEAIPSTIERIDAVELEPAMIEAARFLAPLRRRDPLSDPRVRLVQNDARAALALTWRRFDIVVSQPSRPWIAGSSQIYTAEFARTVRARLRPGGVYAQWMGLNFVDRELLGVLAATLLEHFEYVRVYRPGWRSGLVLLASDAPFEMARTAGSVIAADPEVALALGITRPEDIEGALVLDTPAMRRLAGGMPTNRDRHDRLGPRSAQLVRASAAGSPYFEPAAVPAAEEEVDARALWRHGRTAALARRAITHPQPAERSFSRALVAMSRGQDDVQRRELDAALRADPGHQAAAAYREGLTRLAPKSTPVDVAELAGRAADLPLFDPRRPTAERLVCDALLAAGEPRESLRHLDTAVRLDGGSGDDALRRAQSAAAVGDIPVTIESAERLLRWLEGSRQARARPDALSALDSALRKLPSDAWAPLRGQIERLR
ncbi:MAG: hypothetical protein QNK05_09240 [Myxococcota bacterium]|nr:hypothetical protein [Myxococcota bacterium]